jgi:SAM-dependent methyltransferase
VVDFWPEVLTRQVVRVPAKGGYAKALAKVLPEKKILYTFCVVGMRAKTAAYALEKHGYTVLALKPGYDDLLKAGFKKLSRQETMKVRDSGMPDEAYWETLFDVPLILSRLNIVRFHDVAEFGCGYGTFTVPIARAISGAVYTFDVEPEMLTRTAERAAGLRIVCELRDVMDAGFGVQADAVLLFNVLHCDRPLAILSHARNALRPGGEVLVIHWLYGETPRGPSFDIRPRPEQIVEWGQAAGLQLVGGVIDLPPWHYGLRLRPTTSS